MVHDLSPGSARDHDPAVLAVHGITANGYWWRPLAVQLARRRARMRLYAVCLRGRADSRSVGGPYGLATHAADLAVVCRRLGVRPLLLGHSMGAFVAAVALARFPTTFPLGAVLVDGGVPVPLPEGVDPAVAARDVLRPAAHRLRHRFRDADAYVAHWGRHPGLRPVLRHADPTLLRDIALHDAVPTSAGPVRCGVALEAVEVDADDVARGSATALALGTVRERGSPVELVWARRGLFDEPHGFYDEARLARTVPAGLRATCVEDANHLSVVLVDPGVRIIADVLDRMAGSTS